MLQHSLRRLQNLRILGGSLMTPTLDLSYAPFANPDADNGYYSEDNVKAC
jgi:hypothetical protein